MLFEFGFYSSLLLIPFFHGMLYAVLLFRKAIATRTKSNFFLAAFLLLCACYIAPWMLGFAGWYDNQPYRDILFYVPFQQLFFIGPLLYFYTQSLLNPAIRLNRRALLHFLPGFAYLIYCLWIWVYDYFVFKGYHFYADQTDKDFAFWYQYLGLASMVFYLVISIRYYNSYKKFIFDYTSFADRILFRWVKNYLTAFLIMQLLPLAFDGIALFYPEIKSYTGSWWFFLFFSVVMFYIALSGYANSVQKNIPFELFLKENETVAIPDLQQEAEITPTNTGLTGDAASAENPWKPKIELLFTQERLYENPELTLADLARKLQTNPSVISKAINQGFRMNFNDLVNHFRVEAVKEMLRRGEQKKSTLLGIAYDCGFNSKATFNRAFKKNTGLSPKDFSAGL